MAKLVHIFSMTMGYSNIVDTVTGVYLKKKTLIASYNYGAPP